MPHHHYAYICTCLASDSYHIILKITLHTCHLITTQDHVHCLKTVLGKIGDQYQAYCTTYKTHAMATCHRGAGHPLDRGLDLGDPVYDNQDRLAALMKEINDLH